jgi:hypothetical protein
MHRSAPSALFALAFFALPAAAQERQWTLEASDQDAYLIFGVPESDDVGISMWCPIRQGMVNIFIPETDPGLAAGQDATLVLMAAEETSEIKGKTEVNMDAGISSFEASIEADHPIFAAMLRADRFRTRIGAAESAFPLFDADLAGLLDLCRKD